MSDWITEAELVEAYPKVVELADRDRDGQADEDVIARAITSVEGRVKSRLLTRYRPEQLPGPGAAPDALRRVLLAFAYYELAKGFSVLDPAVERIYTDAKEELEDLVRGQGSLALPSDPPADSTRAVILFGPCRSDRLTLANLED